jgi:hypothetical protein
MRVFAILLLLTSLVACQSITDPLGRQEALEDAQRRYTDFVRWGDLGRASRYLEPEARAAFLQNVAQLEHIRVTDFDVEDLEYDGEDEVHLIVTYYGFSLRTAVEGRFREHQHWTRNPGLKSRWTVKTDLDQVLASVGAGS